jgi:hypothetical protein
MIVPSGNLRLACAFLSGFVSAAGAAPHAPPAPFYNSNVVKIDKIGDGSIVIQTRDCPDRVQAWYRTRLSDSNGETTTEAGGHILYTRNDTTVDIEPGNRFDPLTSIGVVWNAKKYGAFGLISKSARSGKPLHRE